MAGDIRLSGLFECQTSLGPFDLEFLEGAKLGSDMQHSKQAFRQADTHAAQKSMFSTFARICSTREVLEPTAISPSRGAV